MSDDNSLIASTNLFTDADHVDVFAIADALEDRGYAVEYVVNPHDDEPDLYIERSGNITTGLEGEE